MLLGLAALVCSAPVESKIRSRGTAPSGDPTAPTSRQPARAAREAGVNDAVAFSFYRPAASATRRTIRPSTVRPRLGRKLPRRQVRGLHPAHAVRRRLVQELFRPAEARHVPPLLRGRAQRAAVGRGRLRVERGLSVKTIRGCYDDDDSKAAAWAALQAAAAPTCRGSSAFVDRGERRRRVESYTKGCFGTDAAKTPLLPLICDAASDSKPAACGEARAEERTPSDGALVLHDGGAGNPRGPPPTTRMGPVV